MAKKRTTNSSTNSNIANTAGNDEMKKTQQSQIDQLLAEIAKLKSKPEQNAKPEKTKSPSRGKQANKREKRQARVETAQDRAIATLKECIENELKIPWKGILIDFIAENEGLTTGEITQMLNIAEFSAEIGKDLSAPMRGSIYNLSTDRFGTTFEKRGTPAKWYIYEENAVKTEKAPKKTEKTPKKPTDPTDPAPKAPSLEEILEMLRKRI